MTSRAFYIVGLVVMVLTMVISVTLFLAGTRSVVPFVMIGLGLLLLVAGNFFERSEKRQAELREKYKEAIDLKVALSEFYRSLGFDYTTTPAKGFVARVVDEIFVEVCVRYNWSGTTDKYVISELEKRSIGGHTFYFKTGVMGFFFFAGEEETIYVYFA